MRRLRARYHGLQPYLAAFNPARYNGGLRPHFGVAGQRQHFALGRLETADPKAQIGRLSEPLDEHLAFSFEAQQRPAVVLDFSSRHVVVADAAVLNEINVPVFLVGLILVGLILGGLRLLGGLRGGGFRLGVRIRRCVAAACKRSDDAQHDQPAGVNGTAAYEARRPKHASSFHVWKLRARSGRLSQPSRTVQYTKLRAPRRRAIFCERSRPVLRRQERDGKSLERCTQASRATSRFFVVHP